MAFDLELSAEHAHPLLHPREADPLARPVAQDLRRGRVETSSEIADLQANLPVQPPQLDAHQLRTRVLAHVRQALLRDAKERNLQLCRQALASEVLLEVDLVALLEQAVELEGERGGEAQIVQSGG